jgi:hypothetical protein
VNEILDLSDDGRGSFTHADADHQCQQSSANTCAAAAATSALSYCGIDTTERDMAFACGTNAAAGTAWGDLIHGLMAMLSGKPWAVAQAAEALIVTVPGTIVLHDLVAERHCICTFGLGSGDVRVHDPRQEHAFSARFADLSAQRLDGAALVIGKLPLGQLAPPYPPPVVRAPAIPAPGRVVFGSPWRK